LCSSFFRPRPQSCCVLWMTTPPPDVATKPTRSFFLIFPFSAPVTVRLVQDMHHSTFFMVEVPRSPSPEVSTGPSLAGLARVKSYNSLSSFIFSPSPERIWKPFPAHQLPFLTLPTAPRPRQSTLLSDDGTALLDEAPALPFPIKFYSIMTPFGPTKQGSSPFPSFFDSRSLFCAWKGEKCFSQHLSYSF